MNNGISIIVPCFNSGIFLIECIESIQKQSLNNNHEIIIIDDGSTDFETQKILDQLTNDKIPNLIIVKNLTNKGVQHSRNLGLKIAKFDFILLLDSDDCLNTNLNVSQNYIEMAINILIENSNIAFVHCQSMMFGMFSGLTIGSYPVDENQIVHKYHIGISIIYRREDINMEFPYDEKILKWQDWSFAIRLLNNRYKQTKSNEIAFLEHPFHLYRIHNSTKRISMQEISEYDMTYLTVLQNFEIFQKYYPSMTFEEIAELVFKSKPSKLVDLLHIASFDIGVAINIVNQRKFSLNETFNFIP